MNHLFIIFERSVLVMIENRDFMGHLANLMKKVFLQEKNKPILENLEKLLINSVEKIFKLRENAVLEEYNKIKTRDRNIIQMIKDIGIFDERKFGDSFRDMLINSRYEFYNKKFDQPLEFDNLEVYLNQFEEVKRAEEQVIDDLINDFFISETVVRMIIDIFIKEKISNILNRNFEILIEGEKFSTIKHYYEYFKECNSEASFKQFISFYIKKVGTEYISSKEDDIKVVENVKTLYLKFQKFQEEVFKDDKNLRNTVLNSFLDFLNKDPNHFAEIFSKYLHRSLDFQKIKSMEDDEIKGRLDENFKLFRFVTARDIFKEFYNQRMLKRLMIRGMNNLEIERYMLEKFKSDSGEEFVKFSETIINSYKKSLDMIEGFHQHTGNVYNQEIVFEPLVFASNTWPFGMKNYLKAPPSPVIFFSFILFFKNFFLYFFDYFEKLKIF